MEKLYRNCLSPEEAEIKYFAGLLWRAFPGAPSQDALAQEAADYLTKSGRPCHPKTVNKWLNEDGTPHFRYVMPILGLVGVEAVFGFFDPERN